MSTPSSAPKPRLKSDPPRLTEAAPRREGADCGLFGVLEGVNTHACALGIFAVHTDA